jgi:hypothetical protein
MTWKNIISTSAYTGIRPKYLVRMPAYAGMTINVVLGGLQSSIT